MINSFQSISTITSGLILEQLEQDVNASNLAQTSVDSDGYLENSLQQVNAATATSITYTGSNGLVSVGTGTTVESITRLRSSYLDSQIQQQSMTVGYNEILSNSTSSGIMDQIKSIVDGSTTLSSTLSSFTSAWTTLESDPTSVSDQTAVVNAGVTFASTANSEYSQLESLQLSMNSQVTSTVSQINDLLTQLGSINQQLMTTGGSNQNSLLDARDYALDKLSRLTNYQVSYSSNGTASVWIGGVSLVSGTNVSTLQANTENANNPQLVDITVATYSHQTTGSANSSAYDISSSITGGNLGGELYARNVVLQSYKEQVDQVATSVMDITNNLYEAGYVANSTTTGTAFFTGTGASSIAVNGTLTDSSSTSPFVATEVDSNSATGQLAGFLGDMGSLLANNYAQSTLSINKTGQTVDPTASLASQTGKFATTPTGGSFTINGTTITYTTGESINNILSAINSGVSGVDAVFNSTTQQFYLYSSGTITVQEVGADNFTSWAKLKNVLASTIAMNDQSSTDTNIVFGGADSALDSTVAAGTNSGPNSQAFFVTPSATGTFTINGVQVSWNNTESLNTIKAAIQAADPGVSVSWNAATQQLELISSSPITIDDDSGNFTIFTGLNGDLSLTNMAANVSSNASTQDSSDNTAYTSSSDSLTQLNNEQANIAGVSSGSGTAGVSTSTIEAEAEEDMIIYNAMLEVMQVIDQMLDALVGISNTSNDGIFQQETSG